MERSSRVEKDGTHSIKSATGRVDRASIIIIAFHAAHPFPLPPRASWSLPWRLGSVPSAEHCAPQVLLLAILK